MTQKEEAQAEEARLDTLGSLALSDDLANDTIRIALNIVGIDPNSMNQFERASVLLDMAQECQFLRGHNMLLDCHRRSLMKKVRSI